MAGDKFNLAVNSWWKSANSPSNTGNPLTDLVSALNSTIGGISGVHGGATAGELQSSNVLSPSATNFLNSQTYTSTKPKAYINWVLFDEQFNYVAGSSGFEQVGASNTYTSHSLTNLPIDKNGYLYIYVSNVTDNIDVFFDNLQVTHVRGPVLEETHYYPFGLTMAGISSKALAFGSPNNKYKFNSIEQNNDFDLNMYDAYFRNLDPQIGRFWQIDPKPNETFSSYAAMANNPVLFSDPLGDTTWIYGNDGRYMGMMADAMANQVHFLNRTLAEGATPADFSSLSVEDQTTYAESFRKESIAFIGSKTAADMESISKDADKKGFELGFVAEVGKDKEIRLTALPDKYHQDDNKYDLIGAINGTYSKEQQAKLFGAGHVHNKKHVANLSGYDGYSGEMAKFLKLNRPSSTSNGERIYPDYQPILNRQTPAFIISAYGVTTYGTGTGYGGLNNAVQNLVIPNEYNSYLRYKQLKK